MAQSYRACRILRRGTFFAFLAICLNTSLAQNLTDSQTADVKDRLAEGATHSWEYGTRAQALLEHDAPAYSVFSPTSLPPSSSVPSDTSSALAPVFSIAHGIVTNQTTSNRSVTGPQPLVQDGSAADPASIGVAILLANWTDQGSGDGLDYANAAREQLDFLYQDVPKTPDGAISHRVAQVQLWSDFVYMVPPFLAYYGMITDNQTLISDAYDQIKLYRDYLRDTNANNLWKHVTLGNLSSEPGNDEGHWSTGNAWAAAGMLRVLATMKNSQYTKNFKNEQKDLANWVQEIHTGMYAQLDDSTDLFHNYADDSSTFTDAASTALLASTVYRLSLLWGVHQHLPMAEKSRQTLFSVDSSGNLTHFSEDGWLTPVVNPNSYGQEGSQSPEAQAFVLDLQAAWTDWVSDGSKGANGAMRLGGLNGRMVVVISIAVSWVVTFL